MTNGSHLSILFGTRMSVNLLKRYPIAKKGNADIAESKNANKFTLLEIITEPKSPIEKQNTVIITESFLGLFVIFFANNKII